ncbi:ATP-grasp domain-containing protein [Pseudoneobacillus sp. C159]
MANGITGWLIYKRMDAERNKGFIAMLMDQAKQQDINLHLVLEEELIFGIENNQFSVYHTHLNIRECRFAIVRTINPLLSRQLEYLGIRCFNPSRVSEICNDKAITYQFVSGLNIPTLDTYFIHYHTFQPETSRLNFPMVLKQVDGRGGNEVYLVNSIAEIVDKLKEVPHKRFVLQQFSDNPGKDIRVFVIGSEVIGAVLRESSTSFKANYTLGGNISPYKLNHDEKQMVEKISTTLKADFIGIDFLLNSKNQFIFNEIEDVVGCRSLYSTSAVDPAAIYLNYINRSFH